MSKKIRLVVTLESGETEEVFVKTHQEARDRTNEWMRAIRFGGKVRLVEQYEGDVRTGWWKHGEKIATPEQIEEGRSAFMDDSAIRNMVG